MTKKKSDVPQDILQLMHPALPFDEKSLEEPKAAATGPDYSAQLAELSANLKRMEEANQNLQRTNMALMGQPIVPQQPQFGSTEISYENLPDPVTNPKEYGQTLVQRTLAAQQAIQKQQDWERSQRTEVEGRVNSIWQQFGDKHPGLKGKAELIESAATKAVAQAKARGMDPNKYMFANTDGFFDDTVKILADWGIKEEGAAAEDDDTPPQRTSGIPGGLESGGALTKSKEEDHMPTLMDEVKDWKLKTGYYA